MNRPMNELGQLEAAREAAWREYDAAHRAIPDCEHVRAWRQDIAEARSRHQAAILAHRAALAAQERVTAGDGEAAPAVTPEPCSAAPEPAPAPCVQESLFEAGEAA